MFLFQEKKELGKGKVHVQGTGIYRFDIETLRTINISSGFDGEGRMHPNYLEKAVGWIVKNGKKLSDGNWSVEAKLLQPGNTLGKNSLYNFALKEFKKGAREFCKDILQMVKEADDIRKATPKKQDSDFIKRA